MHAVNYLIFRNKIALQEINEIIIKTGNYFSYNRKDERNKQENKPLVDEGPSQQSEVMSG